MSEFSYQGIGMVSAITTTTTTTGGGTSCAGLNISALAYSDTTGMVFISPMPNADDLPYTFTLTNIATGVSYPNTGHNVPNYGGPGPGPGPIAPKYTRPTPNRAQTGQAQEPSFFTWPWLPILQGKQRATGKQRGPGMKKRMPLQILPLPMPSCTEKNSESKLLPRF